MEAETWLTAQQAKEKGLIECDYVRGVGERNIGSRTRFQLPSQEAMEKARKAMKETETSKGESVFILQQKLNFFKIKRRKTMNKKQYKEKRAELMNAAQVLLDQGKAAEAEAKMDEVKELDDAWDAIAQAQANFNALNKEPQAMSRSEQQVKK